MNHRIFNWVELDDQFRFVKGGYSQVGASGSFTNHYTRDNLLQNILMNKNGYLYIYVSNDMRSIHYRKVSLFEPDDWFRIINCRS